jgi:hypothetical protein
MTIHQTQPPLLAPRDAAALLGTTPSTLSAWRVQGRRELPWVKVGKLVRYSQTDVAAFIERQKHKANDDNAS